MKDILTVKNLNIWLRTEETLIPAVNHVSFSLHKGQTLGIIGESGSGKSITCLAALGLLDRKRWQVEGDVTLNGEAVPYRNNDLMSGFRGNRMALIMQNPMSAFNPMISISQHFFETINKDKHMAKKSKAETDRIAVEVLTRMRIREPKTVLKTYAFQLSGGMLQRVMIALALVMEPDVLIADEPTTALDLTIQHEIINLLEEMQRDFGTSILLVSHDLGVISHLASEVAVMYAGNIVERGSLDTITKQALHPYTRGLFSSRPAFSKDRLPVIDGQPPTLKQRSTGCQFRDRCDYRHEDCATFSMEANVFEMNHEVCCKYAGSKETSRYGIA